MRFKGIVIEGKGRGAKMGFPTINVACAKSDLAQAPEGVYAALVKVGKKVLPSVGFLGAAKTFGEREKRVEAYIFGFKNSLLAMNVEVLFLKRLRGNKKFRSAKELTSQMKKDDIAARRFFGNYVYRNSKKSRSSN